MIITLTPDIEKALSEHSRRQGTTPEQLALESLRRQFVTHPGKRVGELHGTLADFLADSIGVLHSNEYIPGGAKMSEGTGKTFTAGLLKKRQQGQL